MEATRTLLTTRVVGDSFMSASSSPARVPARWESEVERESVKMRGGADSSDGALSPEYKRVLQLKVYSVVLHYKLITTAKCIARGNERGGALRNQARTSLCSRLLRATASWDGPLTTTLQPEGPRNRARKGQEAGEDSRRGR